MSKINLNMISEEISNLENSLYLFEKKSIDTYAEERIKSKAWDQNMSSSSEEESGLDKE